MASRRTVTVLFSDVVASTQLRGALGDNRADHLFALHYEAQCAAVAAHHGTVVKGLGDGIMAVFDSAADAVGAAVAIHDATGDLARLQAVELAARVGVAAGDASFEAGDWFGTPVVEASRLCSAAATGQVLVSDLVRSLAGSRTEFDFRNVGALSLKGLAEPVVAHEVDMRADAARAVASAGPTRTGPSSVRFRVLGVFAVERDGVPLVDGDLGSRKARLLLKLLAARRGHVVPMADVVDVLWEDLPPAKAEANVATLVSRVRGTVGADVVDGGRHGYRIALGPAVTLDVDEAEALIHEGERQLAADHPALGLTAAREALARLGRGAVLEDEPGAEWALDLAREAQGLTRRARSVAWRACAALDDHRGSQTVAQDAVTADVLDEEAHRAVMLAYYRLGETGEALTAYERLRAVLVEELGADPGPETEALYTAILRGEAVADAASPVGAMVAADPGFVGREHEVDQLLAHWAAATGGSSSCVLITGESGIGKTRLAAELAARARATGALVLQARCYEAERSLFLQPVIEIIRSAVAAIAPDVLRRAAADRAGTLAAVVPEVGRVLRPIGYEAATTEIERRRSFEAVAEFLGGLARERPLLVVLDDLHEAGASTIEMLHFALRWDRHTPLLIVGTAQSAGAGDVRDQLGTLASTIELTALPDGAVRALARHSGLGDYADEVLALTRGHTLFVVEALRSLATRDDDGSGRPLPVPASLRDAVVTRVHRCGPDVEDMLRAAVVVGSSFDVEVVAELLGQPGEQVVHLAERAGQARLLHEAGVGYEFANDLIRDVLYDTTPAPMRAVRHRRLAALLADKPEAAAGHAAVVGDWPAAVSCWLTAASRASKAFANREAEQLLTLALNACAHIDDPLTTAQVQLDRGRARISLGSYTAAAEDLTAAQQLARAVGDSVTEATALTELGWAAYHARDIAGARELAARAAEHRSAGPRALILVGRVCNTNGDLDGAVRALAPVAADPSDPGARALAQSCLGTALAHRGHYRDALVTLDDAVAACYQTGTLRGLLNARMFGAIVRTNLGDFPGALAWSEQLLADVERFDAPFYRPRALNILASIWRELGDNGRARELAEEALASCASGGTSESEPAANAFLGLAESALFDGDEAVAAGWLGDVDALLVGGHVAFGWRIELGRLELLSRIDPARADELVAMARRYESIKYEALGLGHARAVDEAVTVAERAGSDWLVARVAPEPRAREIVGTVGAGLPAELRQAFGERGALVRRFPQP